MDDLDKKCNHGWCR